MGYWIKLHNYGNNLDRQIGQETNVTKLLLIKHWIWEEEQVNAYPLTLNGQCALSVEQSVCFRREQKSLG